MTNPQALEPVTTEASLSGEPAACRRSFRLDAHRNAFSALKDRRVLLLAPLFLPFPRCICGLSLWLPTIIKAFGVSDPTAHAFLLAGLTI